MQDNQQNKAENTQASQGKKPVKSDKQQALAAALRRNLQRRKQAQKQEK